MPNITGGAGEILVVMDNFNWENSAGELLQDILKEEIPGLPQSEPLFDVIHITAASFDNFYKFHRSMVLKESGPLYERMDLLNMAPHVRYRNLRKRFQRFIDVIHIAGILRKVCRITGFNCQPVAPLILRNAGVTLYPDKRDGILPV